MLARVAVPVPQLDLLTYRIADDTAVPVVGARVVVPLGSRMVTGVVVEVTDEINDEIDDGKKLNELKSIARVLDETEFVPADIVELARWTADYYLAGVGATITAVLPPKTRGSRADSHKTQQQVRITAAGRTAGLGDPASVGATKLKPASLNALQALQAVPEGMTTASLRASGVSSATVRTLLKNGLVETIRTRMDRDPFEGELATRVDSTIELTSEQSDAIGRMGAMIEEGRFRVALLHGVTGSGKTEIYLRLARIARSRGRTVLMLVPEIALTPVVAEAFRAEFGARVAIQHSGLSDGERHDQWQRIRRGEIDVVVGTRSAVFAPLARVGLIVVDEEHDGAYKQEESPRYNGRDVAVVRGQKAGALVVLGSATPSLESYHRAMTGRYEHVVLGQRVMGRPLAAVTVVNMRDEYANDGPDVVISRALRDALDLRIANREQALILLNRRGFATAVFCRQCGGTIDCPNCSVSLVVHGEGVRRRARCHYCNLAVAVPQTCPACAAPYLEQQGFGTERVEAEIARLWPSARVARLDRDAIRRKGSLNALLHRFRAGDIDVLVGTQMIAKGHDFPRVTLVGVISADVGLGMADFRAAERTFQLLTQVAGRAGRGEQAGEAIIQTIYPNHYSIELACRQDYPAFYERELQFRLKMHYPPRVALASLIVRAPAMSVAMRDAQSLGASIARLAGAEAQVLGPAPAPLARLRGEYRAQLLVKGGNRRRLQDAIRKAVAEYPAAARRTVVDVDPISVL